MFRKTMLKEAIFSLSCAGLLAAALLMVNNQGSQAQQSNFVGGEPDRADVDDGRLRQLTFYAGSRSNWHHHDGGQILMITEGRGATQVRGEAPRVTYPGQPWYTPPGVEHWHGAHPDEDAHQYTISRGTTRWQEPVSDSQYAAVPNL